MLFVFVFFLSKHCSLACSFTSCPLVCQTVFWIWWIPPWVHTVGWSVHPGNHWAFSVTSGLQTLLSCIFPQLTPEPESAECSCSSAREIGDEGNKHQVWAFSICSPTHLLNIVAARFHLLPWNEIYALTWREKIFIGNNYIQMIWNPVFLFESVRNVSYIFYCFFGLGPNLNHTK